MLATTRVFSYSQLLAAGFLPSLTDPSLVSNFLPSKEDDVFLLSNGFIVLSCSKYFLGQGFPSIQRVTGSAVFSQIVFSM